MDELSELGGADDQLAIGELDGHDSGVGDEGLGEGSVVGGCDGEAMGAVGHEAAYGAEVARGSEATGDDDEDLLGEALDLVEDVGREDDGTTLGGHAPERPSCAGAGWIGAVEGLVEEKDARLVDDSGGDLDALLHTLGVSAELARFERLHAGEVWGGARRLPGRAGRATWRS